MRDFPPASPPILEGSQRQHSAQREKAIVEEIKNLREDQIVLDASFLQLDGHPLTGEKDRQHPFLTAVPKHERMYAEADGVIRHSVFGLVHSFPVKIQDPVNTRASAQLENNNRLKQEVREPRQTLHQFVEIVVKVPKRHVCVLFFTVLLSQYRRHLFGVLSKMLLAVCKKILFLELEAA